MFEGQLRTTLWYCWAYLLSRLMTRCAASPRLCWIASFLSAASRNRRETRICRRHAAAMYRASMAGLKNTGAGKSRLFTSLTYAGSRGYPTTELACTTSWTCSKSEFGSGTYRFTEIMNDYKGFLAKVEHTVWVYRTLLYSRYWIGVLLAFFWPRHGPWWQRTQGKVHTFMYCGGD